jgi:hypothetical protein
VCRSNLLSDNSDAWLKRAKQKLLAPSEVQGGGLQTVQFATSMLTALYGPVSPQLRQFEHTVSVVEANIVGLFNIDRELDGAARAIIRNTVEEIEAGLILKVRVAVAGEVLSEMTALAKDVMVDRTNEAKNAAAVLVAAAYEGLLRKMGEEFAGVTTRPKLGDVITALKAANVLKGGQTATAQSYLKFRNDSLHADWTNVDRSQVESCLAFSESLLLKHFS